MNGYQNKQNITEIFLNENADGGQIEKCPKDGWKKFQSGGIWGGYDKHMWFKTTVEMLPENEGKTVVFGVFTGKEGQWDAKNPQFYAYVNGKIIQGMDVNHTEFVLTKNAKRNEVFEIVLYAYSGMNEDTANFKCYTANFDENINALYYDIFVPLSVAKLLDKEDKRRVDILEYLNNTANILDTREIPSADFDKSVKDALCYIETEFYGKYCGNSDVTAKCVGHTHIDVAWLWTLAQTREKTVRSFSTVLNLMKQYPEYVFMSSQPQLYQYLKEENPALYGEIKERVKEGRWENAPDWCFWDYPLIELAGKTLGIIGFGRIGQKTGTIAKAMGMNVLAYDSHPNDKGRDIAEYVELDEIFAKSDVISLHCPLFPSTEGIINKDNIARMKDGVIIINNSRGQLIVEKDLADALNSGKVYAAGLDVVSTEPVKGDNPLLKAKNCIITPHISWAPKEARQRIMDMSVENLKQFLAGNPVNVVNR